MFRFSKTHYASEALGLGEGSRVRLAGWIFRKRELGGVIFIVLRDSTGSIQVVVREPEIGPSQLRSAREAGLESSIIVEGVIRKDPRAPGGTEVLANSLEVVGESDNYPIRKGAGEEFLLDNRHLHLRSRSMWAILRIRAEALRAAREWFDSNGFTSVEAPSIVGAAVEGGATLFEINYFGKKAYLTQSSQFYLEAAIFSLENVYTIQPSFRAEKSRTRRHLTEFWHVEAEMAWADLNGVMEVVEGLVGHMASAVAERGAEELEILGRRFDPPDTPFPRISYDEAVDIAKRKGVDIEWGDDLSTEAERAVSLEFDSPVFVHRYPKSAKAFYHRPDPSRPEVVLCVDLLAPEGIGEIVGGGQRIHDYDLLVQRIREEGLNVEDYKWYLDLRKYGSVPHGGFGLGLERTVRWIAGLPHIRAAVPFPRTITRVTP